MRLFPAVKHFLFCTTVLTAMAAAGAAHAQQAPAMTPQQQQMMQAAVGDIQAQTADGKAAIADALAKAYGAQAAAPQSLFDLAKNNEELTEAEMGAALKNKDSAQYKAHVLAKKAKADMSFFGAIPNKEKPESLSSKLTPPPEMETLQQVAATHGSDDTITDDAINKDIAMDMRKDAQREAALSYGARGGLSKRSYQLMEDLAAHESTLDSVFNFRQLLIKAPSGLMIEPPIVKESLDATVIVEEGAEAAVADQVLKIGKQARIVTAPRDWRQYLVLPGYESEIPPPPRILWPKNKEEQADWNGWVRKGWEAGYNQGDEIFESNLSALVADYTGMVRYRMLLTEGKISQPFALQEDRGVTGGGNEMRVGDRALRITGPSEFLTGANVWKPADR